MSKPPTHHGKTTTASKAPAPPAKSTAPAAVAGGLAAAPATGVPVAGGIAGTVVSYVEGAAGFIGGLLAGGKLSLIKDVTAAAVKSAVVTLDNGVDHLLAAVDKDIAASPVGVQAVSMSKTLLSQLGIPLPSEQQIVDGVKAAIADLANAVLPGTGASAA